jgi:hypothetical protein
MIVAIALPGASYHQVLSDPCRYTAAREWPRGERAIRSIVGGFYGGLPNFRQG